MFKQHDLHDPIAQIFAGEKINLDKFEATFGPDCEKRAENIATRSLSFHIIIDTILRTLYEQ